MYIYIPLGNIRVFVRVRPQIKEDGLNCENVISYDDLDDSIIYVRNKQKGKTQTYEFDQVFKDTSTQQQVEKSIFLFFITIAKLVILQYRFSQVFN